MGVGPARTVAPKADRGTITFSDGNVFKIYVAPRVDEFWAIQAAGLVGLINRNVFQGNAKRLW